MSALQIRQIGMGRDCKNDVVKNTTKIKSGDDVKNVRSVVGDAKPLTITDIKPAIKNPDRVNVFINSKYRFSLDVFQVTQLGVKVGLVISQQDLAELEQQSEFGKLYVQALNYCLIRPRSEREIRDYLRKKTFSKKLRDLKTGEIYEKKGVSEVSVEQVITRLKQKNYLDDEKFARFWLENRNQKKGSSLKKLRLELSQKGVASEIIEQVFQETVRTDQEEIAKIIAKKAKKYPDPQKLLAYLVRQGFSYEECKKALSKIEL